MEHLDEIGETIGVRYRLALEGGQRFQWRKGDKVALYGLQQLPAIRAKGWVLLVEGESDTWTAWQHDLPALGIPGKSTWKSEWAACLGGLDVYLWQEPDALDLAARVAQDLPGLRCILALDGTKDINEAHLQGADVPTLLETLRAGAVPAQHYLKQLHDKTVKELRWQAAPVLAAQDPLDLVRAALRGMGYGGDRDNPILVYLAATSRLLSMRPGNMPVHLLLLGPPSAGKSYTLQMVLGLLPPEAYHTVEAGSPRVVIYDDAPLKHRVLVFSEADSLPAGEDNPAASAIRNLAQDHELHYVVTIRDPETGDYTVREVRKEGPTVLVTTSTKPLGGQLGTRVFTLDLAGDADQIRAALAAQATLEVDGATMPDPSLAAFQAYLQALAPWDVVVPFARQLSTAIGRSPSAPRILRDYQRLLSLTKAVATLRHQYRHCDARGRLVADAEDYRAVYELVHEVYAASVTGVTSAVTELVTKVRELHYENSSRKLTYAVLSSATGWHRDLVRRRANTVIRLGYLANRESRKNHQADLIPGDPLPERAGLPSPEEVWHLVTAGTDGYTDNAIIDAADDADVPQGAANRPPHK
jgi:hypothetical protein